jgi:hypothetical protein
MNEIIVYKVPYAHHNDGGEYNYHAAWTAMIEKYGKKGHLKISRESIVDSKDDVRKVTNPKHRAKLVKLMEIESDAKSAVRNYVASIFDSAEPYTDAEINEINALVKKVLRL